MSRSADGPIEAGECAYRSGCRSRFPALSQQSASRTGRPVSFDSALINRRSQSNAGFVTWPKLFQNLRASRQTELEESFPTHVVCSWMGNSPKVAREHYLQTTEDHFKKATLRRGISCSTAELKE